MIATGPYTSSRSISRLFFGSNCQRAASPSIRLPIVCDLSLSASWPLSLSTRFFLLLTAAPRPDCQAYDCCHDRCDSHSTPNPGRGATPANPRARPSLDILKGDCIGLSQSQRREGQRQQADSTPSRSKDRGRRHGYPRPARGPGPSVERRPRGRSPSDGPDAQMLGYAGETHGCAEMLVRLSLLSS